MPLRLAAFRRALGLALLGASVLPAHSIEDPPLKVAPPARTSFKFTFGSEPPAADATPVRHDDAYSVARGYGFERGTAPDAPGGPFFFSVAVPEGNYRVTVTFGGIAPSANTVKAESRRLMVEGVRTAPGGSIARAFLVNVRNRSLPPPEPHAPGGAAVALNEREQDSFTWDDKLTLEFNGVPATNPASEGEHPAVRAVAIEPAEVPTVFLVGDSTVADQPTEDYASWGQMLPRFLRPDLAVANHAESGETMKSFIAGLRLAKVLSQLRAGDWLLIQFGHNDEKPHWPQTYVEAGTTYPAYLRVFIAETRRRGATPVLVTPMQRRAFDPDGKIRNTHGAYPQAMRDVAAAEHIALIDLEAASRRFYEALGPERAPRAFADGGRDATHHNNYGAYQLAKAVVQGLRDARLPLAEPLGDGWSGFDPAQPDPPDTFRLAPSPPRPPAGL